MEKKTVKVVASFLLVSVLLLTTVSAIQWRPMNQINHPGLTNPNTNNQYDNHWLGWSKLCENDNQMRPMNQGFNIPRFFSCIFED